MYVSFSFQGKVDLFKQNNELLYRLKDVSASKVKGVDVEEKVVYKIVEEAGNKGIWARDIRFKSNLSMTQLNKILNALEGKKLIKAVTSVSVLTPTNELIHSGCNQINFLQAAKKKVYMLFNVEPDRSITGGAWYSDQDFESEFIDILNQVQICKKKFSIQIIIVFISNAIVSCNRRQKLPKQ